MFNIDIKQIILSLPWILLALVFHEYCHAWVSYRLGDPTPKSEGRLSLNPLVHLDPIGLLSLILFRFGWAKPVQINPMYYKDPMKGTLWVSLAGPGGNFILAIFFAVFVRIFWALGSPIFGFSKNDITGYFYLSLWYNLMLGFFNLIPIPPLDGSKILRYFIRGQAGFIFDRMEPYGFFILIILMITGIISSTLLPFIHYVCYLLTGLY